MGDGILQYSAAVCYEGVISHVRRELGGNGWPANGFQKANVTIFEKLQNSEGVC